MFRAQRKIRAKVVFFRELRGKCVKKSEESGTTMLSFTKTSSYRRAGKLFHDFMSQKGTFSVFWRFTSRTFSSHARPNTFPEKALELHQSCCHA